MPTPALDKSCGVHMGKGYHQCPRSWWTESVRENMWRWLKCCQSSGQLPLLTKWRARRRGLPTQAGHQLPHVAPVLCHVLQRPQGTRPCTNASRDILSSAFAMASGRPLRGAQSNMPSVTAHPQVINDSLAEECAQGRIMGPLRPDSVPGTQINRFGLIPKRKLGEWRLIVDLLSPEGRSVND